MKRVSDQTSNIASEIGATYILVFLNMEVATHKRNDKVYINLSLNCNHFLCNNYFHYCYLIYIMIS